MSATKWTALALAGTLHDVHREIDHPNRAKGELVKALSIRQPYADQICRGEKLEEYRSWPTTYRGPLLVCAAKTLGIDSKKNRELPRGVAVAVVNVVDCYMHGSGYYAWVLDEIQLIKQFPVKGKLGLFEVDVEEEELEFVGEARKKAAKSSGAKGGIQDAISEEAVSEEPIYQAANR